MRRIAADRVGGDVLPLDVRQQTAPGLPVLVHVNAIHIQEIMATPRGDGRFVVERANQEQRTIEIPLPHETEHLVTLRSAARPGVSARIVELVAAPEADLVPYEIWRREIGGTVVLRRPRTVEPDILVVLAREQHDVADTRPNRIADRREGDLPDAELRAAARIRIELAGDERRFRVRHVDERHTQGRVAVQRLAERNGKDVPDHLHAARMLVGRPPVGAIETYQCRGRVARVRQRRQEREVRKAADRRITKQPVRAEPLAGPVSRAHLTTRR